MRIAVIAGLAATLACGGMRRGAGKGEMYHLRFAHGGFERACLVYVPKNVPKAPRPLLFAIHGGGGTAEGMVRLTRGRFNELADRDGFFVAYPSGVERHWNDMRRDPIDRAHAENIDDVGFIRSIAARVAARYPIDRGRIFATGISNGGFMSLRLACEASDLVRGAAVVAAQNPVGADERCRPSRPVSLLFMNGTDDPLVPYRGGDIALFGKTRGSVVSTDETLRFWAVELKCGPPVESSLADADPSDGTSVTLTRRMCGRGSVLALYRVQGGGHAWPGGWAYLPEGIIGRTSRDISACDVIWEFFSSLP